MDKPKNTYGTEISATYLGKRTRPREMPGEQPWEHHAWDVTLTRNGESITFPYMMGVAHEATKCGKPKPNTTRWIPRPQNVCHHVTCERKGWIPTPPTLHDVLTGLKADDTQGETFHDWCANFGMDTDSRKAMDLYLACQESTDRSRRFFDTDWALIIDDEDYT